MLKANSVSEAIPSWLRPILFGRDHADRMSREDLLRDFREDATLVMWERVVDVGSIQVVFV